MIFAVRRLIYNLVEFNMPFLTNLQMVGVATENARFKERLCFCCCLGEDENSWGISSGGMLCLKLYALYYRIQLHDKKKVDYMKYVIISVDKWMCILCN